jgi:hypothetical protein
VPFVYTTKRHLPDLFDATPARRTMSRLAAKGGDRMTEVTIENTPIGGRDLIEGPGVRGPGGNLRTSWRTKRVMVVFNERGEQVYQSGTETHVSYAPYVEHGTGLWGPEHRKYLIEAKPGKWLSWITRKPMTLRDGTIIPAGRRVFFKRVWHPGSPGQHMVAIAAGVVEAELHSFATPILERWKRETEGGYVGIRLRFETEVSIA